MDNKMINLYKHMIDKMTRAKLKIVKMIAAAAVVIALGSCAAVPAQAPAEPSAPPEITPSAEVTAAPTAESMPTPVKTTAPEPSDTPEPSKSAPPARTPVPAGIVKNSGEIIGSDVAFRDKPSPDSGIITRLQKGTFVQILKTNVNAQWHKVKYDGKTGYVNRMYICLDSSLDGYALDFTGEIVNCSSDVNVRSAPSTDAEIIGVAQKGSKLSILPHDDYIEGWYKVEFEGKTAYISSSYLDVTAQVDDTQLADISISGGRLYPSFTPNEYGYVVRASKQSVTIKVKANKGVAVAINGSNGNEFTINLPDAGMKTVRIALNGEVRYSVYISRNLLTVGTWNIKRGNGNLLMQGQLIYDQQPDIMGIQEAFQDLTASDIIDNLASLKTKDMSHNILSPTINYSNGSQYGNGILSKFDLSGIKTYELDSGSYERRIIQKAVVNIDGKAVSFYNTHFSYNSAEIRKKQFAKLKELLDSDKNEYKIVTGDFNAGISEFKALKNYTVVNTEETKYYDYSKKPIDYNEIDNIIVSKNIKVVNSRLVVNKFSDHYPLFAYLLLN
jgi:endonuclease/exonuclease/phosphatase family metal-dependent hydrolase